MKEYCKECVHKKTCKEQKWEFTTKRGKIYKNQVICDKFDTLHYGIYNSMAKRFQFGIDECSEKRANRKLFDMIGYDSYKWRFEAKRLPKELWKRTITKPRKNQTNSKQKQIQEEN